MAQFLRPDSLISAGSWTNNHTAIDEATPSDTDRAYSQNNPNGSIFEVGLSNPAGAPGAGTRTVRYRHAQVNNGTPDGGGTATSLSVMVVQGTTIIATDTSQSPTGTWTTRTWTPDLSAITDWNDVRLRFTATGGGGNPANRRGVGISWAEIEIPDAAPAPITGTLSAQESGSDTASMSGDVLVSGTLSAQESGSDTATMSGTVSGGGGSTPVILVVLAGQSNINGRNTVDGLSSDTTDVYQYVGDPAQGDYQTLTTDITPLDHADGFQRTGPDDQLFEELASDNPGTKIVLVPCSYGAQALVSGGWTSSATPGGGGLRYENMVNQANAARTAALALWSDAEFDVRVYFIQGESDADGSVAKATYYSALVDFVSHTRSRITDASAAPIIIGSLLPQRWIIGSANYSAAYAAINEAHVDASLNLTNVKYIRGPDDRTANDNLHYQPASVARTMGTRLSTALTDVAGPSVTTGTTQYSTTGRQLAIALTHNDPYDHATFEIDGGADAAQFELSDEYISPTLRWAGNGTGPAIGSYEVGLRARDGMGNYGSTVTITVNVVAVGAVPPSSFFGASDQGAAWDLTNLSNLFQDVAGTVPVTAAGQVVGKVLDVSGKGNHFVAAADNTTRPTYQVDSDGKPYLQFDGSNDILIAPTPFTKTDGLYSASIGVHGAAAGPEDIPLSAASNVSTAPWAHPFDNNGSGVCRGNMRFDNSGQISTPNLTGIFNSTKRVLGGQFGGGNKFIRIREPAVSLTWTSTVPGSVPNCSTTRMSLGGKATATPGNFFAGRVYSGWAISRVLTDAEQLNGEDWVTAKTMASAPTEIVGDAAITLDPVLASGAAELDITGDASVTLDPVLVSGEAVVALQASSSVTLDPVVAASQAELALQGSSSIVLDPVTASGAGELALQATASVTLDPVLASGDAVISLTGSATITLDPVLVAGEADLALQASTSVTLDPVVATGEGALALQATSSIILDPVLVSSEAGSIVTGEATITLDPVLASGESTLALQASGAVLLEPVLTSAQAEIDISGSVSVTLDPVVATSIATVDLTGTSSVTLDPVLVSSQADLLIVATSSVTLEPVLSSALSTLTLSGSSSIVLDAAVATSTAALGLAGTSSIVLEPVLTSSLGEVYLVGTAGILLEPVLLGATGQSTALTVGDANILLDPVVANAESKLTLEGTTSVTLEPVLSSSEADVALRATSSVTLEPVQLTSQAEAVIAASASVTLEPVLAAGEAELLLGASSSITLDPVLVAAEAVLPLQAATSVTLDPVVSTSSGQLTLVGASSITLDELLVSSAGQSTPVTTGSASITLDELLVSGAGQIALGASATIALDPVVASSQGALSLEGSSSITLDALQATSEAALGLAGASSVTLDSLLVSASAGLSLQALSSILLDELLVESQASAQAFGSGVVAIVLDPVLASGEGQIDIAGQLGVTLDELLASGAATLSLSGVGAIVLEPALSQGQAQILIDGQTSITLGSLLLTAFGQLGDILAVFPPTPELRQLVSGQGARSLGAPGTYTRLVIEGTKDRSTIASSKDNRSSNAIV